MASKIKREFKNVVYNYSDAEAKVREATSNDPWGPSSAVMTELADYTFHVQAYSLVMGMLWKRLNDHGKNWRHVYKSLTVLEYVIKGGSERVSQQCKDNIFSIQTLKDFQYVDKDGKDQGANVREKAKQLVALLKDDRKLKEERAKAHTARERQQALGSDSPVLRASPSPGRKRVTFGSPDTASSPPPDQNGKRVQPVEQARPSNLSEEEMQLKLALQLSKQQADEEAKLRRQEEESLTAALALSVAETGEEEEEEGTKKEKSPPSSTDLLLDLDTSLKDPWGASSSSEPLPSYDSVVMPATTADPWLVGGAPVVALGTDFDLWGGGGSTTSSSAATNSLPPPVPIVDPWSVTSPSSTFSNPPPPQHNPFDLSDLGLPLPTTSSGAPQLLPKIEAQFLGTNANLVDLDLLTADPPKPQPVPSGPSPSNPFGLSSSPSGPSSSLTGLKPVGNPFEARAPSPSLIQLASTNTNSIGFGALDPLQAPLVPVGTTPLVATGNPLYPPLTAQSTVADQTFNPFS